MSPRWDPLVGTAAAVLLYAATGLPFLWAGAWGIESLAVRFGEAAGLATPGWAYAHVVALAVAAVFPALAAAGALGAWLVPRIWRFESAPHGAAASPE